MTSKNAAVDRARANGLVPIDVNSIRPKITHLQKNARACYPMAFIDCWLGDDVGVGHADVIISRIELFYTWIG